MHPNRKRKVHVDLLIIALFLVTVELAAFRMMGLQAEQFTQVAQTRAVLDQLTLVSNRVSDAETGQREYLLAGQEEDLTLYVQAVKATAEDISNFERLTSDYPHRRLQVAQLHEQIAAGFAELKQEVDIRQPQSQGAPVKMVLSGRDRPSTEAIHQQIDQMRDEEQRLLKGQTAKWQSLAAVIPWMFLVEALLLIVLLRLVYAITQKEEGLRNWVSAVEGDAAEAQRESSELVGRLVTVQRDVACARQDLQAALQTLTERAQEITHASGSAVELAAGEELICRASSGALEPHAGLRLNEEVMLSAQCMEERRVLTCDDTEEDDRVDPTACRKVEVRSLAAVPILQQGTAIGVLSVTSSEPGAFTQQDIASLELLAELVSSAVNDAAVEEDLRSCRERLDEAQAEAHLGTWTYDIASEKSTWSKQLFRLAGRDPILDEPDYTAISALIAPNDAVRLSTAVQRAIRDGIGYELDLRPASPEGETRCRYHASGKAQVDAEGKVIRIEGAFMDISQSSANGEGFDAANFWPSQLDAAAGPQIASVESMGVSLTSQLAELEAANARLEALATSDALTGLKNHRAFQERLSEEHQRALRYGIPLSVVMLDIDRFKQFNDTFGHTAGDDVLRQVAAILESTARTTDVVARFGGEEFAVLLLETDAAGAVDAGERIRHAIARAGWEQQPITVSVGAATLDAGTELAAQLIGAAEAALWKSKTNGRNCVTHTGGLPPVLISDTLQSPAAYVRRFQTKLGHERPSRRLLDSLEKAS